MKNRYWRMRCLGLTLAATSLFTVGGCGLSDLQLSSIWQSVLQTGLNTLMSNTLTTLFSATGTA